MGTKNSVIKVSPAGHVDGQVPALLSVPDFDPAHFVAPTANGTWTLLTGAQSTAMTAFAALGYLTIKMGSTLYRLSVTTAT